MSPSGLREPSETLRALGEKAESFQTGKPLTGLVSAPEPAAGSRQEDKRTQLLPGCQSAARAQTRSALVLQVRHPAVRFGNSKL